MLLLMDLEIVNRFTWKVLCAAFDLLLVFFLSQGEETKTLSICCINSFIPHLGGSLSTVYVEKHSKASKT